MLYLTCVFLGFVEERRKEGGRYEVVERSI